LRSAIASANSGDTINFSGGLAGQTIHLTSGELLISINLTIDASALSGGMRIDAGQNSRILELSGNVGLNSLTLTNGHVTGTNEGGGVLVRYPGTLSANNCTFSGNSVDSANLSTGDDGGGIADWSQVNLYNCTVSGNYGGLQGGGIYVGFSSFCCGSTGNLTMYNCTVAGNTAVYAGGLYAGAPPISFATYYNCTISGNTAINPSGDGGFRGRPTMTNTIVAGNINGDINNTYDGANDFVGGDPQLAPLGNYGGPTQTMPPLGGSPVIDGGADSVTNILGTDQSGSNPRLIGAHVDIGSVEFIPYPVSTTNDTVPGSLRYALIYPGPGRVVTFSTNLNGKVFPLTNGELLITSNITIDASALSQGITINGGGTSRVMEISNATVTLNSVTLTNGYATGATFPTNSGAGLLVDSNSTVTANNCGFSGNNAASGFGGAIVSMGSIMNLNSCSFLSNFAGFGGCIFNRSGASLTVSNSAFSNNTAGSFAGAIESIGTATLYNCALSGNYSGGYAGAVYVGGHVTLNGCTLSGNSCGASGGGIENVNSLTLNNCTLASNSATGTLGGGGIYSTNAANILNNCTLSGNSASVKGGGICNDVGSVSDVTNTIIAGNTAPSSPDVFGAYSGAANFVGGNPQLAALANYGGFTLTMRPLPGSPVIDAGNNSVTSFLATDQRGLSRLSGPSVDIGAVEARYFIVLNTNDSGPGSLRNAVTSSPDNLVIPFTNTLSGQTILLTSGELLVTNSVVIDGSTLAGGIKVDGNHSSRVLEISNANVTLYSVTVTNGYAGSLFPAGKGGGVLVGTNAALTASNCAFSGNSCLQGGGIESFGGLTLQYCSIFNNGANDGGGIYGYYGATMLNNCTISSNTVANTGGGVYQSGGSLTLDNCAVSGNSATNGSGGGISDSQDLLMMNNCIVSGNSAQDGGALFANPISATLNSCIILSNFAVSVGGIETYTPTATIDNCTISGNSATNGEGGGLLNLYNVKLNNSTISGNSSAAPYDGIDYPGGGGIANEGNLVVLNNCTLSGNTASNGDGGGLYNDAAANILVNCTVSGNSAGTGGGIYNDEIFGSTVIDMTNTIVAANTATSTPDVLGPYTGRNNFVGGNPQLAALGNNGGPTQTMLPMSGSPVISAGIDVVTNFLATDQRGYPRLSGRHVDIGAAEVQFAAASANNPPVLQNVAWSAGGGGSVQFNFTNVTGAEFTALSSSNLTVPLSNWIVLGTALELSPGQYQFTDTAATNKLQFYQVVSP
jgi:parallel beta-helix repeat protein